MSAPSSSTTPESESAVSTSAGGFRLSAPEIDASLRWPLLLLFLSGILWLAFGTVLALIASIKLHGPNFLADCPWLTLGRVRPAAMNSILYGFASQVGIGVMLWMMCRLGGVKFAFQGPVIVAWKLWNLGVTVGVIAIMAGASTGFEWLEMPRAAAGMLFVAYAIAGLTAVATFASRRERELFPSQWYLLAAIFWFPWIYSAANYLLLLDPVRGSFQAVVNGWYTGNFAGLWLSSLGLAGIYYFLPRLTGQPLHSRELAGLGFWIVLVFTGFSGLTGLIGGPVPRWMPAVSTAASVCLVVAVICNGLNWHLTCRACCTGANRDAWKKEPLLGFVLFGALCYLVQGVLAALYALPQVASVTNFTYAVAGKTSLLIFGFVGMVLFGCLYYILPRLVQVKWPNEKWVRLHLLCSIAGVAILFLALTAGGILQGRKLADASIPFINVVTGTIPFVGMSTLGLLMLLIGQGFLLANFVQLLRAFCEPVCRSFCAQYCGCAPVARAGVKS
jgi:cytochrome c oxidase cbb3-type subunit 1